MLKPIERNPRPVNPIRPSTDPGFQAAVRRALAARAAAEGRPPESHGYETAGQVRPGDTFSQLVGPDGVANNRQFPNPDTIYPGEIYFQQGPSPVSAQTEGVIDTALAYDREHDPNSADSQRNWDAVQSAIAGELRQTVHLNADGKLDLTADQQAKLQALNSWAVGTDRLSQETQQALTQVDGEVQKQSRDKALDQTIAAIQGDLDKVDHKLDDQSFVRKGWGWITPGKSAGEEFQDFLKGKLDDLKKIKADDTGLPEDQYQQKLTAVLGNFEEEFKNHAQDMEDSDKTWNTVGEVGRVVAATTVGIVTTAATGGNVVAGFAAGFGTYQLIDTVGDVSAVVQGKDMYADGHTSLIGFGMDAVSLDGDKGDGWGVSWDHTKAALKDTAIDAVSSISTAGATAAGIKVSAAVSSRLASTALPALGSRVIATSASGTVGQVVNGTGQLATDATRLAFDNKLFSAEGGQQMLNSAKTQGIYLATSPVTGAISGAIPVQRVVSTASAGTTQAAQQGASQAAASSTQLSRLGLTAQFGNDVASNLGGAELAAQLTEGRHMNRDEAISAVMGAVPGTAQNLALHPQMMQRVADRRDMLQANGGMRDKDTIPSLWSWQGKIPEFRLGAQVRILGNSDTVTGPIDGLPQLGQPTLASFGGAISTKMNIRAMGQSVIDSLVLGSTKPFRLTLGKELTVSQRPREYRNITGKEAGVLPASNQTVFQIKGSTVKNKGHDLVLGTDPAEVKADFMPTLQKVRDVGAPRDENGEVLPGTVMELSWSGMLPDAQQVTLHPGEMDLFGTVAGQDAPVDAFVTLPQDMTFTKLMEEQKVGARPRAWTNFIPVLNKLWRVGGERRPEDNITVTIPKGTKVSEQAWDNMRGTYERVSMRTRIVVDDATRQLLLDSTPDLATIHDLVGDGTIDPARAMSYVPGRQSGMRLSAVTGKYAEQHADLLTGKGYTWHPDAANADFIFNDRFPTESIPGLPDSLPNPDQAASNAAYRARKGANDGLPDPVTGVLPKSLGGDEGKTPLVRGVPSKVNLYRRLAGPNASFVAEATRFTGSFKLPTALSLLKSAFPLLQRVIPFDLSLEFRGQVKIDPPGVSKQTPRGVSSAVRKSETIVQTYTGADGSVKQLPVPSWLDSFLKWSEQGQGVLFPEGGVHAMKQYLKDLHGLPTTRQQQEALVDFRRNVLPKLGNETLTTPETARTIRDFLEGQAKPVGVSAPGNPMPLWTQANHAGGTP
jgi:hypothetical protein